MNEPRSFASDDRPVITGPRGQRGHRDHFAQSERLARQFYRIGDFAWCLVGNGLSNQVFVEAPEGIIAIDTGESVEEMREAIGELRERTTTPIVAVLYTHFHYVQGTRAVVDDRASMGLGADFPIHGHARIAGNLQRSATAIGPAYARGLVEQFSIMLPTDGPDGNVNIGLGFDYRNARHAPFTSGHLPVTHSFDGATTIHVAGLDIDVQPAPSDADDSVTYWFPALDAAVHNIVWPALFNVFAIRGEEYRDPRVLLHGLDHVRALNAEHLIGAHGPPLSGRQDIRARVTKCRDAIQFLWDQTVRHTNMGATSVELAHRVVLPETFDDDYLTSQLYGLVEHHTRQIRSGLFGWFDGDVVNLFPLERTERADRFIVAMGGVEAVRATVAAISDSDTRWALELAGLLVARAESDDTDRRLLASVLRTIAYRTTAANIRSWCLTRALDLEDAIDMSRHYRHRLSRRQIATWSLSTCVDTLRVMLVPERATGIDCHLEFSIDGESTGLHFRNFVACPTDGTGADATVRTDRNTWLSLLASETSLADAEAAERVTITGSADKARLALAALDHSSFAV